MKTRLFISGIAFATCMMLAACGTKSENQQATDAPEAATEKLVYACPMHPEVTGKADDTCNKCGMALEKVEKTDSTNHSH